MVAAAQETTKRLTGPKKGHVSQPIPIYTRLKARNLYLSQGLPHKVIAEACGVKISTVQQLAHREGWTKIRAEQVKRLYRDSDARAEATSSEALDAIASVSEQHALRTLDRVGQALERDDMNAARDAQSYTGALKNLVSVAREIRAPAESAPTNSGLVAFVIRVGDEAAKPEVNVTPANTAIELPSV